MKKARGLKAFSAILSLLLVAAFAMPAVALADEQLPERETKYFNVDIVVNTDNSYDFTETVGTVFNTSGHGIYRYVPLNWDGIDEDISGGWCSTDDVAVSIEENNYVLQMGSADKFINGEHEFKYGYNIRMRDDRDTSKDLLYIDLLPTNWQTPIGSTDITVHLPKAVDESKIEMYSGDWSAETLPENVTWEYDGDKTITVHGVDMELRQGITMFITLPEGYWVGQYNPTGGRTAAVAMSIIMLLAFVVLWFLFGRRQKVVETVEFHPPEGVTPAEIGLMIDGSLDKKDMVSMFMYFAQRGYLKIKEVNKKHFQFVKLEDIDKAAEKKFAQILYNGIFYGQKTVADSNHMGREFGQHYLSACNFLEDFYGDVIPRSTKLVQRIEGIWLYVVAILFGAMALNYSLRDGGIGGGSAIVMIIAAIIGGRLRKSYKLRKSGKKFGKRITRIILWIVEGVLLLMAAVGFGTCFENGGIGILIAISFAACQALSIYFDKMSKKTYAQMGKIMGLKNFIETAELDRLNMLVEEDPDYFFNILPYAYVLGLTDKWAKKFESIHIEFPGWYETDTVGAIIPAIYMETAMNDMVRHMGTAVTHSLPKSSFSGSDSGSSSFGGGGFSSSGGGFSGGGAGGGGGGFW